MAEPLLSLLLLLLLFCGCQHSTGFSLDLLQQHCCCCCGLQISHAAAFQGLQALSSTRQTQLTAAAEQTVAQMVVLPMTACCCCCCQCCRLLWLQNKQSTGGSQYTLAGILTL
jgi:streptolysin S family bacteriocin protoxin